MPRAISIGESIAFNPIASIRSVSDGEEKAGKRSKDRWSIKFGLGYTKNDETTHRVVD